MQSGGEIKTDNARRVYWPRRPDWPRKLVAREDRSRGRSGVLYTLGTARMWQDHHGEINSSDC